MIINKQINEDNINNEVVPKIVAANSKIFIILILSILFNIVQAILINSANERAETRTELKFVKMYPNGTWDVEYRERGDEVDFFPLTIDKTIHEYVEARYGVNPHSIRRDYGFSMVFMSPKVSQDFVGTKPDQFNAAEKAKDAIAIGDYEEIKIRFTDHFDVSSGSFVKGDSDIYRTNVFIERTIKDSNGIQQGKPIKEVVNLHWRLKSVKEVKDFTKDQLRANPIGLEIIKEKKTLDAS